MHFFIERIFISWDDVKNEEILIWFIDSRSCLTKILVTLTCDLKFNLYFRFSNFWKFLWLLGNAIYIFFPLRVTKRVEPRTIFNFKEACVPNKDRITKSPNKDRSLVDFYWVERRGEANACSHSLCTSSMSDTLTQRDLLIVQSVRRCTKIHF